MTPKRLLLPVLVLLLLAVLPRAQAQAVFGNTNEVVGPAAGGNSVVLLDGGSWTASTNAPWLHLSPANQAGTGSTNVVFSFDANPGATRSGALTIANETLTVTQAGSAYVAAGSVTTLAGSGLNQPQSVAVDDAGNVYFADSGNQAIKEWSLASQTVTTLVSSNLSYPYGVAVDGASNVYIADTEHSAIKEWNATSQTVTTLVGSGINQPFAVAVDGAGNVYFADTYNQAIKEWNAASQTVTTLVSSGLSYPAGVAVDAAGNVYIADNGNSAIKKWSAASQTVTTLVGSGLSYPHGVAVDGAGNVYIADTGDNAVKEWNAASQTVTTLVGSGVSEPAGVVVDGAGNLYIADTGNNAIEELPRAWVNPTPRNEPASAGSDTLAPVLPTTENLLPPFGPASDQSWLTVSGVANGIVSVNFTANPTASRTADVNLLGISVPVTQAFVGTSPLLTLPKLLSSGTFQFSFTNLPGAGFTVFAATSLSQPFNTWSNLGAALENPAGSGHFQVNDPQATNNPQRYYRVQSP